MEVTLKQIRGTIIAKGLAALACHLPLAVSIPCQCVYVNKSQNSQQSHNFSGTLFSPAKLLASWSLKTVRQ